MGEGAKAQKETALMTHKYKVCRNPVKEENMEKNFGITVLILTTDRITPYKRIEICGAKS
jgi:membrane protein YdbS with pleckstrin-like domain